MSTDHSLRTLRLFLSQLQPFVAAIRALTLARAFAFSASRALPFLTSACEYSPSGAATAEPQSRETANRSLNHVLEGAMMSSMEPLGFQSRLKCYRIEYVLWG